MYGSVAKYDTQLLTNGDGSKWLGVEIIFRETFKRERERGA